MAPANRVSNQEEGGERARERQEIQEEKEGALGLHWLPRQQATVEYIKTVFAERSFILPRSIGLWRCYFLLWAVKLILSVPRAKWKAPITDPSSSTQLSRVHVRWFKNGKRSIIIRMANLTFSTVQRATPNIKLLYGNKNFVLWILMT